MPCQVTKPKGAHVTKQTCWAAPAYKKMALDASSKDCIVTDPPAPMTLPTRKRLSATAVLTVVPTVNAPMRTAFDSTFIARSLTVLVKHSSALWALRKAGSTQNEHAGLQGKRPVPQVL